MQILKYLLQNFNKIKNWKLQLNSSKKQKYIKIISIFSIQLEIGIYLVLNSCEHLEFYLKPIFERT